MDAKPGDGCHSVRDAANSMVVIFDTAQTLPEFVITFRDIGLWTPAKLAVAPATPLRRAPARLAKTAAALKAAPKAAPVPKQLQPPQQPQQLRIAIRGIRVIQRPPMTGGKAPRKQLAARQAARSAARKAASSNKA